MGSLPYKILEDRFKNIPINENNIVLEIGSERGEGSTFFLNKWAKERNIQFYSIDVTDHAKNTFPESGVLFKVVSSGSEWCKNALPLLNKKIKVLYLDNFDWIWDENNIPDFIVEQIDSYLERGVVMNNHNSQEEHRLQSLYCLPYMDDISVVIFDDTWINHSKDSGYDGKCGEAIPLFINNGFIIENVEKDDVNFLIGHRNIKNKLI